MDFSYFCRLLVSPKEDFTLMGSFAQVDAFDFGVSGFLMMQVWCQ